MNTISPWYSPACVTFATRLDVAALVVTYAVKICFLALISICLFLPFSAIGFHFLSIRNKELALLWLVVCSLFFYGWWEPIYLALIIPSILFNFLLGKLLANNPSKTLLIVGVTANLGLMAIFKYAGFAVETHNEILGTNYVFPDIILPLAISFFTFQQIAYLADARAGKTREYRLGHYFLFVTFFPQLIAGPIVHHREMMPQFMRRITGQYVRRDITIGVSIFIIGLVKKVLVADNLAPYANEAFTAAGDGAILTFFEAWRGVLAYTFQLYFDFSGYSDMAIGAARIFGIRIPVNFNSPYKATSIIDFWRRWHITLSRFLRDYVYIPLGGSRKGKSRRWINILFTMILGGLWHGAGWTFVFWGLLHGLFLITNHGWVFVRNWLTITTSSPLYRWTARMITFLSVAIAWTYFRANDFETASSIVRGLFGQHGVAWPADKSKQLGFAIEALSGVGVRFTQLPLFNGIADLVTIIALITAVWLLPNTHQLFDRVVQTLDSEKKPGAIEMIRWQPSFRWAIFLSFCAFFAILRLESVNEFLYFQF